jgi:uncharacterized protein (TIGR02594 family)
MSRRRLAFCISIVFVTSVSPAAARDAKQERFTVIGPDDQPVRVRMSPAPGAPRTFSTHTQKTTASIDENSVAPVGSRGVILNEALKYRGATARQLGVPNELWCADFLNFVLKKTGIDGTHSRAAKSFLAFGRKVDDPRVGAIVILKRARNGGHVGIVRGTDGQGNPVVVSGNHGKKVAQSTYPKSRVLGYVMPDWDKLGYAKPDWIQN